MSQEITIRHAPGTGLDVLRNGLSSGGGLTVGEVIEQVLSLLPAGATSRISADGRPCYAMRRKEEWAIKRLPICPAMIDDVGGGL